MDIIKPSGGIANASMGFHLPIECASRELLIAFEHHVFEEMSHAVFQALFNGTACSTPKLQTGHG